MPSSDPSTPASTRPPAEHTSLDPADWAALRAQGHRMLDDALDYLERIRSRPVWRPIPPEARAPFHAPLPTDGNELAAVHERFLTEILPYAGGNVHPAFMGWVQGGGTPVGMLAEMLAGALDANVGGRDHMPVEVERQVVRWMRELFGFPETASGLFVTGSSIANFLAVLIARTRALGTGVRARGVTAGDRLVAYASSSAHECIAQAMDLSGLGTDALRVIPADAQHRFDVAALEEAIAADRAAGRRPFLVVGTAGTVDVGAIDDLAALADVAQREDLWFHVDGALGALGVMSPELAPRFAGIERSDSIAFDFHKWSQVPYDAGFLLVRDGEQHRATFSAGAVYLRRASRGMAGGDVWPCDLGPDLSRGFRALKAWFTLETYGTERIGAMMAHSCELARHLEARIAREPSLELLAPVALNIVCFGIRHPDADRLNAEVVADLHESGIAAPSVTTVDGRVAIRAAIVNHRTEERDVDALVDAVLAFAARRTNSTPPVATR